MPDPLLATKFYIPPPPAGQVQRPRLMARLNECLTRKLALVCAPAGYGKTTLVSEWVSQLQNARVGWLSLDEADSDLARFLRYLIAVIGKVEPGAGESALALVYSPRFGSPKAQPLEALLNTLVNDLVLILDPIVLVLEDYHVVHAEPIHQSIAYLLDHLPPHVHFVITSRAEPPLPLSRLRGRGQLVELRTKDLRFSDDEAVEFFNRSLQFGLGLEKVAVLTGRTEGWIAGLQMAAVLMLNRDDVDAFIHDFTGSARFIMDYLVEEVLQQQPDQIQQFLLSTSILDKLCGELCDEILIEESQPGMQLGRGSSASPSASTLSYLERANLFLVPLDDRQEWYRYHRLFADLLRKRLGLASPELIPALHQRASQWFERNGYIPEAITHRLAAGDFDRAAYLVEQAAEPTLNRSETSLFLTWVEQLPDASIRARPSLCVFHALALMLSNQKLEAIQIRLEQAQAAAPDEALAGEIAALRALLTMLSGDIPKSIQLSRLALELLTEDRQLFQCLAADNLGMCYVLSGDLSSASQAFEQVLRIAQRSGNKMMAVAALSNLTGLQVVQGRLRQAWAGYQEMLELATHRSGRRLPVAGKVLFGLGELAREMNDLEAASRYLTEANELLKQFVEVGVVIACLSLARVRQAQGDWEGAWDLLHQAQQLAAESRSVQMDDRLVEVAQAHFWIRQGRYEQARSWAKERRLNENTLAVISAGAGSPGFDMVEPEYLILARLYLAQGEAEQALEVLAALLAIDERKGRGRRMIEVLALQAVALEAQGEVDHALNVLQRALAIAGPEGYVRTFIDEGAPMKRLLHQAVQRGIEPEYAGRLLAALLEQENVAGYPERFHPSLPQTPIWKPAVGLIEPLSGRELEVLQLIAQGLSNSEVAARLVISLSTVKGHTANIYSKLAVNNRTQAVARARELGLLRM